VRELSHAGKTHLGQEGGCSDWDAAAGPVEEDYVGEHALVPGSGCAEQRGEGDVPDAKGKRMEGGEGGGEVGLVYVARARDLDNVELVRVAMAGARTVSIPLTEAASNTPGALQFSWRCELTFPLPIDCSSARALA